MSTQNSAAKLAATEAKAKKLREEIKELQFKERLAGLRDTTIPPIRPSSAGASTSSRAGRKPSTSSDALALVPVPLTAREREAAQLRAAQAEMRRIKAELVEKYELERRKMHLHFKELDLEDRARRQEEQARFMKEFELRKILQSDIMILTVNYIPGYNLTDAYGVVHGAHRISAEELEDAPEDKPNYPTNLARMEAYAQLLTETKNRGGNCVIDFRWRTRNIGFDYTEVMCMGTALKLEPIKGGGGKGQNDGGRKGKGKNGGGGDSGGNLGIFGAFSRWPTTSTSTAASSNSNEDDEDDDENDGEEAVGSSKKGKGKQKQQSKEGKKGGKLTQTEQLVAALMHLKLQDAKKAEADKKADAFYEVLRQFFRDNTTGSNTFAWLDKSTRHKSSDTEWGYGYSSSSQGRDESWTGTSDVAGIGWPAIEDGQTDKDEKDKKDKNGGKRGWIDDDDQKGQDPKKEKGKGKGKGGNANTSKNKTTEGSAWGQEVDSTRTGGSGWGYSTSIHQGTSQDNEEDPGWK